jgi:hypothetical protein
LPAGIFGGLFDSDTFLLEIFLERLIGGKIARRGQQQDAQSQ